MTVLAGTLMPVGCASDHAATDGGMDAGGVKTLEALDPGPEVGALPGSNVELAVRYSGEAGAIAGFDVAWAIFGDPRGSTLSAATTTTDADGIARVTLNVAPYKKEFEFQVRASADATTTVDFFVAVSATGFATLLVEPTYDGEQSGVSHIEVILYAESDCEQIDTQAPPDGGRRQMLGGLGEVATFSNLLTQQRYAVFATAIGGAGQPVSGCIDLDRGQLAIGFETLVLLRLAETWPLLAESYTVTSALALGESDAVANAVAALANAGDCPLDPAQRWLDGIVEALGPGATADAVNQVRAAAGEGSDCRAGGLDDQLATLVDDAATDLAADLRDAVATDAVLSLADSLSLDSTLTWDADLLGVHTINTVGFALGEATVVYPTTGPAIVPLPTTSTFVQGLWSVDQLTILPHSFTIRAGAHLAQAIQELALAGISPHSVGAELAMLVDCAEVDALVCEVASLEAGCLGTACQDAAANLDAEIAAGLAELDGTDLDLRLDGHCSFRDNDGDGILDALENGWWNAALGTVKAIVMGTFEAVADKP
jgi:hypothetical protein